MDADLLGPVDVALARGGGGCLYYARTSLCASVEGREACEAIERDPRLSPVEEGRASFPAAPSFDALPYDRDRVEVVWFRVSPGR
jgi:hypothetical protein